MPSVLPRAHTALLVLHSRHEDLSTAARILAPRPAPLLWAAKATVGLEGAVAVSDSGNTPDPTEHYPEDREGTFCTKDTVCRLVKVKNAAAISSLGSNSAHGPDDGNLLQARASGGRMLV